MKIDIKTIIIGLLLVFSIIFFWKWYTNGDSTYKKELDALARENKSLQDKRDSLYKERLQLENELKIIQTKSFELEREISNLEKEVEEQKRNSKKSRIELDKLRAELEETKKKIEELKTNPPNRTGDDLLNSLRNKTKK
jgi:chromosome segregation ATPase